MPRDRLTKNFRRVRVRAPSAFKPGSLRTVTVGTHKIIVGRPRGSTKTRAQAILHPRTERHRRSCPTCAGLKG